MKIPTWVMKAVIGAVISTLVIGIGSWGASLSKNEVDHEKRISVVEEHQKNRDKEIDESLTEIKAGLQEQRTDMKEVLKRLPRR